MSSPTRSFNWLRPLFKLCRHELESLVEHELDSTNLNQIEDNSFLVHVIGIMSWHENEIGSLVK